MEIKPDIFLIKTPLPNNPLGFINAYLVKTADGCLLVDNGWNTNEAFEALKVQLQEIGVSFSDIKYLFITHVHPDHYGLTGRLLQVSQAEVILHDAERSFLTTLHGDYQERLNHLNRWLDMNGVPSNVDMDLKDSSRTLISYYDSGIPEKAVLGGEHIRFGPYDFEIIWTPGHAAGHICLYEPVHGLFFAGDHVLQNTTPNVSMHDPLSRNPLADYLISLKKVKNLPVKIVLPGHAEPFVGFAKRIDEIIEHHEIRLEKMLNTFNGTAKTAYQLAAVTPWSISPNWEDIPPFHKRFAITETISHLELLSERGALTKALKDGVYWYQKA